VNSKDLKWSSIFPLILRKSVITLDHNIMRPRLGRNNVSESGLGKSVDNITGVKQLIYLITSSIS
jgi:hypothetical protein